LDSEAAGEQRDSQLSKVTAAAAAYLLLSAVATWPLLRDMGSRIVSDPGDPLLNTSILAWNATTLPFSRAWWNSPHYYPSHGVVTFTENLLGVSPIATPLYWLSGNALLAHNLTTFLTWPFSALAAFLLVRQLVRRDDAAFLGGLAFAFTPYRAVALGHIQTLATFGVPLMLLGLHGFLQQRRARWLVLFGAAWIQQGFANGYYILYGGLLIALWLVYFCGRRDRWQAGAALVGTWAIASLPLVPMLIRYRQAHAEAGLHRTLSEILYYSARPASWFEVGGNVWFWRAMFPDGKDNLFPGATIVALAVAGIAALLMRRRPNDPIEPRPRQLTRAALGVLVALCAVAIAAALRYGKIATTIASIRLQQRSVDRPIALAMLAGVPLVLMTPRTREALIRRSPLIFYAVATLLFAVLCYGPVMRVGSDEILSPAPYAWLMALPGFDELRVPTQLKMIVLLCLSVTAALAFDALRPRRHAAAAAFFAVAALGLLLDGWMSVVPMAEAPTLWPVVEPAGRAEPILELPLGPQTDFAATYRASLHHRRVLNGVSGYDPPHYPALKEGLAARDPAMLAAIASLGAFDIVVNRAADPDGAIASYAAAAPGAIRVADDGMRVLYRVPAAPPPPRTGDAWPVVSMRAVRHETDAARMHDRRLDTKWGDSPQFPDQWILADLGTAREVAGVTNVLGENVLEYPRRLRIDVSIDGETWEPAWEGNGAAAAFLGYVRAPRRGAVEFVFAPRPARFVRLRQLASVAHAWWVLELEVHGPPTA
jgi:hypothetical protein